MNYVVSKCIKCNNKIINFIISFLIVNNYNKYIYMQIIIPMSGLGTRFVNEGYKDPKPLIVVDNKPIIEHVVNLFPNEKNYKLVFPLPIHQDISYEKLKIFKEKLYEKK